MLELKNYKLFFQFSEVHPSARLEVIFHRTLRIPDDEKTYPLPPSLGTFPIAHVDDYKDKVPEKWIKHGGVMLPMWQSEAVWLQFVSCHVPGHSHVWPFAIKVSTGKRSAVTGKAWSKTLREGDYLVIPEQKWLDGYVVEDGVIRQFIAAPLGMGATAEEQITGKAEHGGLQIEVYPMSAVEYMKRWPQLPVTRQRRSILRSYDNGEEKTLGGVELFDFDYEREADDDTTPIACAGSSAYLTGSVNVSNISEISESWSSTSVNTVNASWNGARGITTKNCSLTPQSATIRPDMGLAPGGRMAQQVFSDTYGMEVWDTSHHDRCFVHLSNSLAWKAITGKDAPTIPLSAADYSRHGMPWFSHYCDAPTVKPSKKIAGLKSAIQIGEEKGVPIVLENESAQPKTVVHTTEVRDGKWG
jgi:hypothetical protein